MDTSTRNRVIAKAVEVLGIGEVASHLHVSEALVHTYAAGDQSVPDPVWQLTVNFLIERIAKLPVHQIGNLL